jgi:hypothetical protein
MTDNSFLWIPFFAAPLGLLALRLGFSPLGPSSVSLGGKDPVRPGIRTPGTPR